MGFLLPNEQGDGNDQQMQQEPGTNPSWQETSYNPPPYLSQYNPAEYGENPQITYSNGQPILINGRELTAFERIDLMDGVLDGKYFGAPIIGLEEGSGIQAENTSFAATAAPYPAIQPPVVQSPVVPPPIYNPVISAAATAGSFSRNIFHPPPAPIPQLSYNAYRAAYPTELPKQPQYVAYPSVSQPYYPSSQYYHTQIQPNPGTSIHITAPPVVRDQQLRSLGSTYF